MPSWNIHIAGTERLLARDGCVSKTVRDRNAFLFGNVVPDIFVGYMVPGVEEPIAYRITHFADPEPIPKPREREFWDGYVAPLLGCAGGGAGSGCGSGAVGASAAAVGSCVDGAVGGGVVAGADDTGVAASVAAASADSAVAADSAIEFRAFGSPVEITTLAQERERLNRVHYPERYRDAPSLPAIPQVTVSTDPADVRRSLLDLTLGAWAHLLADNIWNTRVNEYLARIGGHPSEEFRIKKQGDFSWFGKTLHIESVPVATPRLCAAAAAFAQYPIARTYVDRTVGVIHETVRSNPGSADHPPYRLLTDAFFGATFAEVVEKTDALLRERLR